MHTEKKPKLVALKRLELDQATKKVLTGSSWVAPVYRRGRHRRRSRQYFCLHSIEQELMSLLGGVVNGVERENLMALGRKRHATFQGICFVVNCQCRHRSLLRMSAKHRPDGFHIECSTHHFWI